MAKNNKKRVTMGDVARAAGVSKPVVSAILKQSDKNNSRFSRETMDRVMKVVRELDYRPNRTARKFVKNEKSTIGLLVDKAGNIRPQILTFVVQFAEEHDLEIILEKVVSSEHPRFLTEDMVDGIITFHRLPENITHEIERLQIPLVIVNASGGGSSACHIYFDEAGGMRRILEYFNSTGRQSPVLFRKAGGDHYSFEIREKTFLGCCREMNIPDPRIINMDPEHQGRKGVGTGERILKALKQYPETDAVIVDWDHDALCVYEAARQLKKRIPEDLSVVSISSDRQTLFNRLNPPLSSLKINSVGIAEQTILLMLDLFAGTQPRQKDIYSPYSINIRGS